MGKVRLESRGRIVIPKKMRERLGIRNGSELKIIEREGEIIIRPQKPASDLSCLKGCIERSDIDPLELKKMWNM